MSHPTQADLVEQHACPGCLAPPGSPCRTRSGLVATRYHTPRIILVPELRDALEVRVPKDRGPGHPWAPGPEPAQDPAAAASDTPVRVGYARCSTVQQDLDYQLEALRKSCEPIFHEKISTRVKERPELRRALEYARTIKRAVPRQEVRLVVHELKRLGRGAADLITIAEELRRSGIVLEMLTGPLAGTYDPYGQGAILFAVLAGMAEAERAYIREKTLEGQATARAKGKFGGRPRVMDDDMVAYARMLRDQGVPVPDIARKLVIPAGKNRGKHPSVATVYRALATPAEVDAHDV